MSSIGAAWFLGVILAIVIAACMNPDINALLTSPFEQPMAQVREFFFHSTSSILL